MHGYHIIVENLQLNFSLISCSIWLTSSPPLFSSEKNGNIISHYIMCYVVLKITVYPRLCNITLLGITREDTLNGTKTEHNKKFIHSSLEDNERKKLFNIFQYHHKIYTIISL